MNKSDSVIYYYNLQCNLVSCVVVQDPSLEVDLHRAMNEKMLSVHEMEISMVRNRKSPIQRLSTMHNLRINVLLLPLLSLLSISSCLVSVQAMVPPVSPSAAVRPNVAAINSVVLFDESGADAAAINNKKAVHAVREYPQCEWIPVTVCQGLGYNMTAMPNLIGHTNLLDAEIMVNALKINLTFFHCRFKMGSIHPTSCIVCVQAMKWIFNSETVTS